MMRFGNDFANWLINEARGWAQGAAGMFVALAALLWASHAWSELILLPAAEMSGIDNWTEGQSWGAGSFYSSSGSPLAKDVPFEGGEYAVYARIYTSPSADADLRILIDGRCLVPPMQARVCRIGWVRVGSVLLPKGVAEIRVESPTPGTPSNHSLAALAFCSTPMDDRIARILAFTEWLRHELIRLEAPKPAPRSSVEARERQQTLWREGALQDMKYGISCARRTTSKHARISTRQDSRLPVRPAGDCRRSTRARLTTVLRRLCPLWRSGPCPSLHSISTTQGTIGRPASRAWAAWAC